jgi:GTP cyclohydrolase II
VTNHIPQSYLDIIESNKGHSCPPEAAHFCVDLVSAAKLPSRYGNFIAIAFDQTADQKEHAAFVKGDVFGKDDVLVRIHSECLTGDAIGSLRCDCRDQLEGSLQAIEKEGVGAVLYLRQEGRGIGLTNKLKAYKLQDEGMNTVEANKALGFEDDERDYHLAAHLIKSLGMKSVRLMTNNPNKLKALQEHGVVISEHVEHVFEANEFNEFYLNTKKVESGHMIGNPLEAKNYLTHQRH